MKRLPIESIFIIITTISLLTLSCGSENKEINLNNSKPKVEQNSSNSTENKSVETNMTNVEVNSDSNSQTNKSTESGQCQLTKAPVLKGFFLGQTVDEVDKRIQGFKDSYEKEKQTSAPADKTANFVLMNSGALFGEGNNIKDFSLIWHFLDDKVMTLSVTYSNVNSPDIKSFVAKMSEELDLPENAWKYENQQNAELNCSSFQIIISTDPQPNITIIDTKAKKEKENRLR